MNILAVGCHPDDLEIGCFGTLARYVKAGHKVTACHITNGDLGHVEIPPEQLREIRKKEAEKAAKVIGAEAVTLDISDTSVDSMDDTLNKEMVRIIREVQPDSIPTEYVDISEEIEMKLEALACHASQITWMCLTTKRLLP